MPSQERTERRWAVVHRVAAGGRRLSIPRAIVSGVPGRVTRARVVEALDGSGWGLRCSEGGIPWANHRVLSEASWPARWDGDGARVAELTWAQLDGPEPVTRVTLALPARVHASLTLAAQRQGDSLATYATRILTTAATATED